MTSYDGTIINRRYEVIGKAADGGMGKLYIVRDLQLNGVTRALKMLKAVDGNTAWQQSIEREAYLLMRLQHRCLPQLFDYNLCEDSKSPFIVMAWIDGTHLGQWLEQYSKSLQLASIYYIALEILDALCYLHAQQPAIVHRDLKPANIMLSRDGSIKLIDFGISKQLDADAEYTIAFGTKGYAAPEQLLGIGTDERSDIYSFGALLLMLLGIDPIHIYGSRNGAASLRNRFASVAGTLRFSVPKALRELIIDCMQELPQHRPQQALEVKARLEAIVRKEQSMIQRLDRTILADSINTPNYISQTSKGRIFAVVGAHGGAGSTLLALTLANYYEQHRTAFTYIEHRYRGAQLFYSLQSSKHGYEDSYERYYGVDWDASSQLEEGVIRVSTARGSYCLSSPLLQLTGEQRFALTIQLAKQNVLQRDVLLDYSAHWAESHISSMIQHADCIIIVNSPWIMSQAPQQMKKLAQLLKAAREHRLQVVWISNRDQSFRERKSWLALHGGLQQLLIPELNSKVVLDDLWGNMQFPPYQATINELRKYLTPLIKKVIHLQ